MYACACVFVVAWSTELQWVSHLPLASNILLQRSVVREGHLERVSLTIWRGRRKEEEEEKEEEEDRRKGVRSVHMLD